MTLATSLRRSLAIGRLGVDVARLSRHGGARRESTARLVADRMGRLHGLPQKIGQMLSLADLEAPASPYGSLVDGASQASADESFRWIARALARPVREAFLTIDTRAAAASLGQVHRAILPDGRPVAVKVQYPWIGDAVDTDLGALGMLASPISSRQSGFDLEGYRTELRRSLVEELDYRAEAAALRRFALRRADVPDLVTPDPIDGYCTDRLLTMTWVYGDPVECTRAWPEPARQRALATIVRTFLYGCFAWRELHADPHAGNLRFLRTDDGAVQVGLVDFGCTHKITPPASSALWRLATSGDRLDADDCATCWSALGFPDSVTRGLRQKLPDVTRVLFEPFLTPGPFDPRRWAVAERLAAVLGDDRWTFRFGGPPELLFLIRAFHGVVAYARALDASIDWQQELAAVPPPDRAPAWSDVPQRAAAAASTPMSSQHLKVEVVRDGSRVAFITFPAGAVAHLEDLVPADLAAGVRNRGIELGAIARQAVARGCLPGELVAIDDGGTHVRVWLE